MCNELNEPHLKEMENYSVQLKYVYLIIGSDLYMYNHSKQHNLTNMKSGLWLLKINEWFLTPFEKILNILEIASDKLHKSPIKGVLVQIMEVFPSHQIIS